MKQWKRVLLNRNSPRSFCQLCFWLSSFYCIYCWYRNLQKSLLIFILCQGKLSLSHLQIRKPQARSQLVLAHLQLALHLLLMLMKDFFPPFQSSQTLGSFSRFIFFNRLAACYMLYLVNSFGLIYVLYLYLTVFSTCGAYRSRDGICC